MTLGIRLSNGITIAGSNFVNNGYLKNRSSYFQYAISSDIIANITNNGVLVDKAFPGSAAVNLLAGSTFINSVGGKVLSNANAGYGVGISIRGAAGSAPGTIVNYGLIASYIGSNPQKSAVVANVNFTNGSKTNTTARIIGSVGAASDGGTGSVTNFGTITGGVSSGKGGLTNGASDSTAALITGTALNGVSSLGNLANFGTINFGASSNGTGASGAGTIINGLSGSTIGTIVGGDNGVSGGNAASLQNFGLIGATNPTSTGVSVRGPVVNGAPGATTARIYGVGYGVFVNYGVTNYGTINGTGTTGIGVYHNRGAPVVNGMSGSMTGLITGYAMGVSGGGSFTNYGVVRATGTAGIGVRIMALTNFGTISALGGNKGIGVTGNGQNTQPIHNTRYGVIEASQIGVQLQSTSSLLNDGTITGAGNGSNGVYLLTGATATNTATGIISGSAYGVKGSGYSETPVFTNFGQISGAIGVSGIEALTNGGTISGTGTNPIAVSMPKNGLLTLLPSGKFNGKVVGALDRFGQGTVLNLGGTTGTGTLRDLGGQYITIGNINVIAGANWVLSGSAAQASGGTLTVAGHLDLGGLTLHGFSSSSVQITSGGTLFGHGTMESPLSNPIGGVVEANGGLLYLSGGGLGAGSFVIDGGAAMEFATASGTSPKVMFAGTVAGTKLILDSPTTFSGSISGFAPGDVIDLAKTTATKATINGSTLNITLQGGGTLAYGLTGFAAGTVVGVQSDGASGTNIIAFSAAQASVFWQNDNGSVARWQMSDTTVIGSSDFGNPGTSWVVKGTGDFDGNGSKDILWQNADGTVAVWDTSANGDSIIGGGVVYNPGPAWHIKATGDFNGDHNSDILLQNENGSVAIWEMNGATVIGTGGFASPGAGWNVVGSGDFNGDGKSDILWQNADGTPAIWELNGTSVIGGGALFNPGSSWHIKGSGDFNGDGQSDILWQNDNGSVAIWEMNGTTVIGGGVLATNPGTSWHVKGTGDFNGDGKSDILWQNDNGTDAIWELNGTSVVGGGALFNPGSSWHTIGTDNMRFISGVSGNATLAATPEDDAFVFTSYTAGSHAISGFNTAHDLIEFSTATFANFAAVQARTTASAGGSLVALDANASLSIQGVGPGSLAASNFRFL